MTWRVPVDSADAAELREQESERQRERPKTPSHWSLHATVCEDGWLGEDDDGHPIPCLVCRPHLSLERRGVSNP